jgi:hypothetical protein
MQYAIVINLKYETCPQDTCQLIWSDVEEQMKAAGFHRDGRKFLIDLPAKQACALARGAIDAVEAHLEYLDKRLPNYIEEFYGYNYDKAVNLLLPPREGIRVRMTRWLGGTSSRGARKPRPRRTTDDA